jgi:DNA topoisomerase-1
MPRTQSAAEDVVIVESAAQARTIERHLGPGYRVAAGYGHVRDVAEDCHGVDVGA